MNLIDIKGSESLGAFINRKENPHHRIHQLHITIFLVTLATLHMMAKAVVKISKIKVSHESVAKLKMEKEVKMDVNSSGAA